MKRKIATSHSNRPLPIPGYDWAASFADDQPDANGDMMVGFGDTEESAINDLLHQANRATRFKQLTN